MKGSPLNDKPLDMNTGEQKWNLLSFRNERKSRDVFEVASLMLNGLFLASLEAEFLGKYEALRSKVRDSLYERIQHFLSRGDRCWPASKTNL